MEKGLAYYLKNPEQIQELDETQLAELVSRYPYCQSLLWMHARHTLDHHGSEATKKIQKAAAQSNDLVFLRHQLLRNEATLNAVGKQWQKELEAHELLANSKGKDKVDLQATPIRHDTDDKALVVSKEAKVTKEEKSEVKVFSTKEVAEKKGELSTDSKEIIENNDTMSDQQDSNMRKEETPINPSKKKVVDQALGEMQSDLSEFSRWLMGQKLEEEIEEVEEKETTSSSTVIKKKGKKKKSKKKKSKLQKLIDHSIIEKEEVVTETYADLVADQGHVDKAIELYEKLKLKIPEKSSYFARKIEELKNS